MPEGDTIHHAANRIRAVLEGQVPQEILTPQPRHSMDGWPQALAGKAVRAVEAHGKHLFLRFEQDITLHSHLRMTGSWGVYREGQRWRRAPAAPGSCCATGAGRSSSSTARCSSC